MGHRALKLAGLCVAAVVAGSCRDGIEPYALPEYEPPPADRAQITFGAGQDHAPVWNGNGMVLYYSTDYSALPTAQGALLRIGANGGTAFPVLEDVQRTGGKLLTSPAVSPDGSRVAYLDLISVEPLIQCPPQMTNISHRCPFTQPLLDSIALRVRRLDATTPPLSDPALGIKLAGPDPGLRGAQSSEYTMHLFPFQEEHRTSTNIVLRPSWAPDNQRVAFSDGLDIYVWRVGDATPVRVPNTRDGVSVAWSPDGERIAFTRMVRVDSLRWNCSCFRAGEFELHTRNVYTTAPRVETIRVDGTDAVIIGNGDDPAWAPDGQSIYMRQDIRIVRVPRAGGTGTSVAGADYGRAPAPSPDGRRLAFSRRKDQDKVDWDIWVVSLSQ